MANRFFLWAAVAAMFFCVHSTSTTSANDFIVGCRTRPACGKICKLVCEKTTITAVCYGCECEEICIPGHSRRGCKHCESCCGEDCCVLNCECDGRGCHVCQNKGPECKFCWYDWIACGCAKPRTVKVLTKYQAEKEICWYHWEVVDAADCYEGEELPAESSEEDAAEKDANIYKPAPPEAQVGDVLPLSEAEQTQLVSFLSQQAADAPVGAPGNDGERRPAAAVANAAQIQKQSLVEKLRTILKR